MLPFTNITYWASSGQRVINFIPTEIPTLVSSFEYLNYPSSSTEFSLSGDILWWDGENLLRIRRRFIWNGSSAPYGLQWYESPEDHLLASAFHDWLYSFHRIEVWNRIEHRWEWTKCSKGYADRLWKSVLNNYYRETKSKQFITWLSLHLCGFIYWWIDYCDGKSACLECYRHDRCPLFHINSKVSVNHELH